MEPLKAEIVRRLQRQVAIEEESRILLGDSDVIFGFILGLNKAIKLVEEDDAD